MKKIILTHVRDVYSETPVFTDLNLQFEEGTAYLLEGVSGAGKTSVLRMIAGLTEPGGGSVDCLPSGKWSFAMAFQEERFFETYTVAENLKATCPGLTEEALLQETKALLPAEVFHQPVQTLSGGMKRRLSVIRAMCAPADAVLLDEPLTGLDSKQVENTISYIKNKQNGRLLIMASHIPVAWDDLVHVAL